MCVCVCVKVQSETSVTADYQGTSWDESDPSVFHMNIVKTLQGEYQLTNGYGPDRAPQVMHVRNLTYPFLETMDLPHLIAKFQLPSERITITFILIELY